MDVVDFISFNNKTNISNDPSTLIIPFNPPLDLRGGYSLSLQSMNFYNAWFNISQALNNNVLGYYTWPDGSSVANTIIIPDGIYTFENMNDFMQSIMKQRKHYFLDQNGAIVYNVSLILNEVYYAITLDILPIPANAATLTALGWTNPNNITLTPFIPQMYFGTTGKMLGYVQNTPFPPTTTNNTSIYMVNSSTTPQLTNVDSIRIICNLVTSNAANSNPDTLHSFVPNANNIGDIINVEPTKSYWLRCKEQQFYQLRISLEDQDGLPLKLIDKRMSGALLLRKNPDMPSNSNRR